MKKVIISVLTLGLILALAHTGMTEAKKPAPTLEGILTCEFVGDEGTFDSEGRLLGWIGTITGDIEGDMAVAEKEIGDVRFLLQFLPGINDLVFLFFPHVRNKGSFLHAAFAGPPLGKGCGTVGMEPGIEPLQDAVPEDALQEAVAPV